MFLGPAIMFIILGAAQYRFVQKLKLRSTPLSLKIGRAFWFAGWASFIWTIIAMTVLPELYQAFGVCVATIWISLISLRVCKALINE